MGQRLCALAVEMEGVTLSEAFDRMESGKVGEKATRGSDVMITEGFAGQCDVLIDFTLPEATRFLVPACMERGVGIVIGTTGLSAEDHVMIDAAGEKIGVVQAPNMSLGVNLMLDLVARTAKQLGDDYDIEVLELHHKHKKDAPSGTAWGLVESLCEATGKDIKQDVVCTREGGDVTRRPGEITMQTLRLGDVVGEHTVYFAAQGERIELTHKASSRDTFARGALRAAQWLKGKGAGRYHMKDVLGLR